MTETNKTALTAINKWMFFTYNYPYDFIAKVWGDNPSLGEHLKGKFDYYYDEYGAYGAIPKFYAELDSSNKVKMMNWVIENFNQEQKLNLE